MWFVAQAATVENSVDKIGAIRLGIITASAPAGGPSQFCFIFPVIKPKNLIRTYLPVRRLGTEPTLGSGSEISLGLQVLSSTHRFFYTYFACPFAPQPSGARAKLARRFGSQANHPRRTSLVPIGMRICGREAEDRGRTAPRGRDRRAGWAHIQRAQRSHRNALPAFELRSADCLVTTLI